ncbi:DsbA family protein [Rhodoferax sp.]|uniref:DsbA family protein n=1 Tax=Rhodoferax sp. TaxID=50421 RepID=UPI00374DE48F
MPDSSHITADITSHITYLFDPLCGWCYAAAPGLRRLSELPGVTVTLAPTGLFAGQGARRTDAQFAAYAWSNDQRIQQLTGQPFSQRYREDVLGQHQAMFDSGPATLALTAVALTAPERELEALQAFQQARYVDGRDTSTVAVLAEILTSLGLGTAAARLTAPDSALLAAMQTRVEKARAEMQAFGAQGVPTVIVSDAAGRHLLPSGALYGPADDLLAQLAGC